jgi:hypothetical protein
MLALSGMMSCCGWKVCQNVGEVVISKIYVMIITGIMLEFMVQPIWMKQKWKKGDGKYIS